MKRGLSIWGLIMIVIFTVFFLARPAQGHSEEQLTGWLAEYERMKDQAEVPPWPRLAAPIVFGFAEILSDMEDRHPCSKVLETWTEEACVVRQPSRSSSGASSGGGGGHTGMGSNVEQWRGLVAAYFPASEVERALCIMSHESGGNPGAQNPSSTADGLFQFLDGTWAVTPYAGSSKFDAEANIAAAAWLVGVDGWYHWAPWNRGLCR